MELTTASVGGGGHVVVARLEGELDASNAIELETELTLAVAGDAAGLVLDLVDVPFVDSLGIRTLFDLATRLHQHGQELRLVVPRRCELRRVLDVVQLPAVVPVFATLHHALSRSLPRHAAGGQRAS